MDVVVVARETSMIPCPRRNKKDRPLPRLAPMTEAGGTFVELDDAVGVLPPIYTEPDGTGSPGITEPTSTLLTRRK
jgi:hypothetical protein